MKTNIAPSPTGLLLPENTESTAWVRDTTRLLADTHNRKKDMLDGNKEQNQAEMSPKLLWGLLQNSRRSVVFTSKKKTQKEKKNTTPSSMCDKLL